MRFWPILDKNLKVRFKQPDYSIDGKIVYSIDGLRYDPTDHGFYFATDKVAISYIPWDSVCRLEVLP